MLAVLGLPASLLDDLAAALGEFEKTLEATRAGRRDHVGASADLAAVATEIAEQVRLLDGLVRYRFGDNAELMGAWSSARNVLGLIPLRALRTNRASSATGSGMLRQPGGSMKPISTALSLTLLAHALGAQGAPPQTTADQPYTMEYYYKVQWGHQQEFLQLFLKNHYPLLRKNVESGRILSVKIETPANHMTEDARWDYRVTLRFKNSTLATTTNPQEAAWIKELWPDQETYRREEQRRFEILLAHWDLPVTDITP